MMRNTLECYFLLFFVSAVLGWMMEVTCKLVQFRRFINRGFLIGPYCPIYGFGAVAVTAALSRYADSPVLVFVMAMVICGVLEYGTGYLMEKLFHARWWDYSQRRFNLNGRVCADTLIPFGLLGLVMIYLVKPFLFGLFLKIPQTALDVVCGLLAAGMLADVIVSATVLGKIRHTAEISAGDNTEALTRMVREKLHKRRLTRRALRAFPYAQVYNRKLMEKVRRAGDEVRGEFRRRRQAMYADMENLEKRMREEVNQRKNRGIDA